MNKNIALLIDSENISAEYIDIIIDEANKYGTINYRRIYGDWTTPQLNPWKSKAIEYGLTPVQQYSYTSGKNSSDFTLIIDAMDILYRGKVDSFCIVTSDSDFTKLVTRLKEDNTFVFGMGESKTPISLVNSCEAFSYLDKMMAANRPKDLEKPNEVEIDSKQKKSSITPLKTIMKELRAITENNLEDDGWAHWSLVFQLFQKKFPGFHPRNYGSNVRPLSFFESKKEFEFDRRNTTIFIRSVK